MINELIERNREATAVHRQPQLQIRLDRGEERKENIPPSFVCMSPPLSILIYFLILSFSYMNSVWRKQKYGI